MVIIISQTMMYSNYFVISVTLARPQRLSFGFVSHIVVRSQRLPQATFKVGRPRVPRFRFFLFFFWKGAPLVDSLHRSQKCWFHLLFGFSVHWLPPSPPVCSLSLSLSLSLTLSLSLSVLLPSLWCSDCEHLEWTVAFLWMALSSLYTDSLEVEVRLGWC